jgi:hypothetical protein
MNRRRFVAGLSAGTLAGCGSGADSDPNAPPAFSLHFSPAVNVGFDGNSLTFGAAPAEQELTTVSAPYPTQVASLPPIAGSGASGGASTNAGVPGRQWSDMISGGAQGIDTKLVHGKINVLIAWETTNTVGNNYRVGGEFAGQTESSIYVDKNANDCTTYIAARHEAGWDRVLVLGSIPRERFQDSDVPQLASDVPILNQVLLDCDSHMASHYGAYGADIFVDLRALAPFDFVGHGWTFDVGAYPAAVTDSGFDQVDSIYGDGGVWLPTALEPAGDRIHLSDGGYAFIAAAVSAALSKLKFRRGLGTRSVWDFVAETPFRTAYSRVANRFRFENSTRLRQSRIQGSD